MSFHAEQVGPFQRPEIGELGAIEQLLDEVRSCQLTNSGETGLSSLSRLTRVATRFLKKGAGFFCGRNDAKEVKVSTADEHFIRTKVRRVHAHCSQFGEDVSVYVIVGWRIVPLEASTFWHKGE